MNTNNKRIAVNTFALTVRMFVTMVISLYSSRVILENLGVEDFGIYNVVAGVISMFAFIKNNMEIGTQRYLNFFLGKKDSNIINRVFCTSINIFVIIALVIIILGEIIGCYFIENKLNIPSNRLSEAMIVFQFTVVSSFINIISTPYSALIIAYEKMAVFAYVSVFDSLYLLAAALALPYIPYDSLVVYGFLVCLLSIIVRVFYGFYCSSSFKDIKYTFFFDKELFKEMFVFSGWTMTGGLAYMFYHQGITFVVNIFFGPIVNAAQSLASKVSTSVNAFCMNFIIATKPQITKYYASEDLESMERLVFFSSKISYLIMACVTIPFVVMPDYILGVWLKEVPAYTSSFVRISAIISFLTSLTQPSVTAIHATGKIKQFQLTESLVLMMILPFVYVAFKIGLSPEFAYYIMFFWLFAAQLVRVIFMKRLLGFSIWKYVNIILWRMIVIYTIAIMILGKLSSIIEEGISGLIILISTDLFLVSVLFYYIGISNIEREYLHTIIMKQIHRLL